ncbi:MrcB family domain-containing protein [Sporosarcina sp. A2]|uniref:MrcB family domain-containing protein n=1 Tax=Sporosarcina sp. A2 TaxID=3393449 RepID=UPI003D7B6E76
MAELVSKQVPSSIMELPFINENYKVVGSVGKGNWAFVPWIAIMNKSITNSTQRGYYIVYLFSEDMKKIYLSFAQGVTETSKSEMINVKSEINNNISTNDRFHKDNKIYLGESKYAKQYASSTAIYIDYKIDSLPNDEELLQDLADMTVYYEDYITYRNSQEKIINETEEGVIDMENRNLSFQDLVDNIHAYIRSKGFKYTYNNVANLFLSLKSKPFVIIAGISGTGKTKIAQLFAESIGATESNGQFKLIPVRPDWSDGSELLGYMDLKNEFQKGPLTEMIEHAMDHPTLPHYVLLDEMNLARVEYYFSDVLSVMESRRREEDIITSSNLLDEKFSGHALTLPENLYIIGTVNMDETTHPFSKKVLDRANTLEFNEIFLNNFDHLEVQEEVDQLVISNEQVHANFISLKDIYRDHKTIVNDISSKLVVLNQFLEPLNAHVGYRVRDEICFYMVHNANENLLDENEAFDYCLMQKILPRITGSDGRIDILLNDLFEWLTGMPFDAEAIALSSKFPRSSKKVAEMIRRYHMDGFTSFWIS